ncbi:hypothetical protein ABBQ38_007202 [Trebouxia sp. C0009 RCD-2024]
MQIPRATRQLVLQKLAGQHLAMALMGENQDLTPDAVAACEDMRKTALSAAVDQELKLFKSCLSKVSYSNAAARTDASLIKYPPATAHQVKSAHHSVQQIEASKPSELDPDTSKKRKRSESTTGVSESSQNKQHQEHSSTAAATHTALVDDDIDWTATTAVPDMQLASPPDSIQGDERQLGADEPDTDLAHSQQAAAVHASECLQQQQAAMAEHGVSSSGGDTGDKHVQHAVGEYVKALLDPFYKAGIIDREMYKLVIKKSVNKIVQTHVHAQDADFLLQESDQIQRLLRDYIRYAQKKCHK